MSDDLEVCWSCQGSGMMLGDNGDPCICSHCKYDGVAPREDGAGMSDDLKKRLRGWDHCWPAQWLEGDVAEAVDRIEQLERDRKQNGEDYCALMEKHDALHVKLAKAVEALRKIAAYTHIGTHEQGIVQNAEARIACIALAELEGGE